MFRLHPSAPRPCPIPSRPPHVPALIRLIPSVCRWRSQTQSLMPHWLANQTTASASGSSEGVTIDSARREQAKAYRFILSPCTILVEQSNYTPSSFCSPCKFFSGYFWLLCFRYLHSCLSQKNWNFTFSTFPLYPNLFSFELGSDYGIDSACLFISSSFLISLSSRHSFMLFPDFTTQMCSNKKLLKCSTFTRSCVKSAQFHPTLHYYLTSYILFITVVQSVARVPSVSYQYERKEIVFAICFNWSGCSIQWPRGSKFAMHSRRMQKSS